MLKMLDVDDLESMLTQLEGFSTGGEARDKFLAKLDGQFESKDKNHNGIIDKDEFNELIEGYFQMNGTENNQENVDKYFKKIDTDHSQGISK